jgi:hypothetical protein
MRRGLDEHPTGLDARLPALGPDLMTDPGPSPVSSYTEWDPLEEVIVGCLDGATIPSNHITVTYNLPRSVMALYRLAAGWRYPVWMRRGCREGARRLHPSPRG